MSFAGILREPFSPFKRPKRSPSPAPPALSIPRPRSIIRGVEIPTEIWIQITHCLSNKDLYKLIGLNSVFLEMGLQYKWEAVHVDMENVRQAVHILERLRDPFIAARVKQLVLRLQQFKKPPGAEVETGLRKRLAHRLGFDSPSKASPAPTVKDAVAALHACIPNMHNVQELHIDLWEFPNELLPPVLESIRAHHGRTLSSLYIGGDLDSYRFLLDGCHLRFSNLREIHLEITNRAFRTDASGADDETLQDVVAVFIGNLAPTLEVFRVWCWATVDMCHFYRYLAPIDFKALTTIRIGTAFNKLVRDPDSLKEFIYRNSTNLNRLELRLNPTHIQLGPSAVVPLGDWLDGFVGEDLTFPNLQTLEIYPTSTAKGHAALLRLITCTAPTLLDLVIRDHYFTPLQAREVVEATARAHLRFFRMAAVQLDLDLLDLLSEKQQNLIRLWLSVSTTFGDGVNTFRQCLATKAYNEWNLKDVHLWQSGQEMDAETLQSVATAIPSVNSFFGVGWDRLNTTPLPATIQGTDLVEW